MMTRFKKSPSGQNLPVHNLFKRSVPGSLRARQALRQVMVVCALFIALPSFAAVPSEEVTNRILSNLATARPDLEYSAVMGTPIDGLYEVRVNGGPTLYVTEDGNFFIAGDLFTIDKGRFVNLQEKERSKERVELMAKVDKADQIIFSPKGEVKAYVNVFTDVDCGYCQKLHKEIKAINDYGIEVRYLAYPRSGPGSPSANKLATAWCSDDRNAMLTKLKSGADVKLNVCPDNPVDEQYHLGGLVGVNGTPNMVTANGELIGGYLPAEDLAKRLGVIPRSDIPMQRQ